MRTKSHAINTVPLLQKFPKAAAKRRVYNNQLQTITVDSLGIPMYVIGILLTEFFFFYSVLALCGTHLLHPVMHGK